LSRRNCYGTCATRITGYQKIVGFRNVLIHGYAAINDSITWRIVRKHLPVLVRELDGLLAEPEPTG